MTKYIHSHLPTPRLRQRPLLQYLRLTSLRVASENWTPSFQYLVVLPGGQTGWTERRGQRGRQGTGRRICFRISRNWQFWCNDVILWSGALQLLHQITFSHNSFICEKSLTVVPHKEAVFSTSTTLPLYLSMVTTCPSRVLALMSWKAMLLPMSAPAAGRPLTVHGVPSSPHGSLQNLSLLVVVVARKSARGRAGSFWSGFVGEILKLLPILLHFRLMSPKWLSWLGHRVRTMTVGLDAEWSSVLLHIVTFPTQSSLFCASHETSRHATNYESIDHGVPPPPHDLFHHLSKVTHFPLQSMWQLWDPYKICHSISSEHIPI